MQQVVNRIKFGGPEFATRLPKTYSSLLHATFRYLVVESFGRCLAEAYFEQDSVSPSLTRALPWRALNLG